MKPPIHILHQGRTPLLVSLPHAGTVLPAAMLAAMQPRAREVEDTDWFLDRLYAFVIDMGASMIAPISANHATRKRLISLAFILVALNRYFETFESVTPEFVARVWLGELYVSEHPFSGYTTDRAHTLFPMADLIAATAPVVDPAGPVRARGDARCYTQTASRAGLLGSGVWKGHAV